MRRLDTGPCYGVKTRHWGLLWYEEWIRFFFYDMKTRHWVSRRHVLNSWRHLFPRTRVHAPWHLYSTRACTKIRILCTPKCLLLLPLLRSNLFDHLVPRGLTFTWWGCCRLCFKHKPAELAHSFSFCSCVYFCLYGPFNCILFHNCPHNSSLLRSVLPVLILPYLSFQL